MRYGPSAFEQGFTVAIDGSGGSGKSSLARAVAEVYGLDPEQQIIYGDHYFEPADKPGVTVVDGTPGGFNEGRFMEEIGDPLGDPDLPLRVREYRWAADEYVERPQPDPRKLMIVEGIKLFGLPVNWGVKIWVQVPRGVREQRFLDRPLEQRRIAETDRKVLLERFNRWADDAEAYERRIDPMARPTITVVHGDVPPEVQLAQILPVIERQRPRWVDPPETVV